MARFLALLTLLVLAPAASTAANHQALVTLNSDVVRSLPVALGRARGQLWLPPKTLPTTALLFLHPSGDYTNIWFFQSLAESGFAVLGMASRAVNDRGTVPIEEVVLDAKAGMMFLRNEENLLATPNRPFLPKGQIQKIVLVGHSGGGPTLALYQAEAENNTITHTPAGQPVDLSQMPLADGLILLEAHRGRSIVIGQKIDASVTDEDNLYSVDPTLDIYNPANGYQNYQKGLASKYSEEFLIRYRKAQLARVDRITEKAVKLVHEARAERERIEKLTGVKMRTPPLPIFAVHRAWSDPRTLDVSIDPDDRVPGVVIFGDPITVNHSPFLWSTAAAWLSNRSRLHSNETTEPNVARIRAPMMYMWGTADDSTITRQDAEDMFTAMHCESRPRNPNKELVHMPGLNHSLKAIRPEFEIYEKRFLQKMVAWVQRCVERDCSATPVRRVRLLAEGEEPLPPATITDPISRIVPWLPPNKQPCPDQYR